jgi:hypothetical protein
VPLSKALKVGTSTRSGNEQHRPAHCSVPRCGLLTPSNQHRNKTRGSCGRGCGTSWTAKAGVCSGGTDGQGAAGSWVSSVHCQLKASWLLEVNLWQTVPILETCSRWHLGAQRETGTRGSVQQTRAGDEVIQMAVCGGKGGGERACM